MLRSIPANAFTIALGASLLFVGFIGTTEVLVAEADAASSPFFVLVGGLGLWCFVGGIYNFFVLYRRRRAGIQFPAPSGLRRLAVALSWSSGVALTVYIFTFALASTRSAFSLSAKTSSAFLVFFLLSILAAIIVAGIEELLPQFEKKDGA